MYKPMNKNAQYQARSYTAAVLVMIVAVLAVMYYVIPAIVSMYSEIIAKLGGI